MKSSRMFAAFESIGRAITTFVYGGHLTKLRNQQVGLVVFVSLIGLLIFPPVIVLIVVLVIWQLPRLRHRRMTEQARREFESQISMFVSLLQISLSAGSNMQQAVADAAPATSGSFSEWSSKVSRALENGIESRTALRWPHEGGDAMDRLVDVLMLNVATGAPIADALSSIKVQLLADERNEIIAWSRKCPVYLLFPLVLCILPAFVTLSIVPLVVSGMSDIEKVFAN